MEKPKKKGHRLEVPKKWKIQIPQINLPLLGLKLGADVQVTLKKIGSDAKKAGGLDDLGGKGQNSLF